MEQLARFELFQMTAVMDLNLRLPLVDQFLLKIVNLQYKNFD
jgi:hypothetical protein